jgi:hypothetical protein
MTWEVLYTEEYERWFLGLQEPEQIDVQALIDVLEIRGPLLGRPHADTVRGSTTVKNLKELVIQHAGKPYRVFFAFDPKRRAVLLCGGRKDGAQDKLFYKKMIALAESEFENHLQNEKRV